jgi:hypothetical protein
MSIVYLPWSSYEELSMTLIGVPVPGARGFVRKLDDWRDATTGREAEEAA